MKKLIVMARWVVSNTLLRSVLLILALLFLFRVLSLYQVQTDVVLLFYAILCMFICYFIYYSVKVNDRKYSMIWGLLLFIVLARFLTLLVLFFRN